jgi:hypothetical protein
MLVGSNPHEHDPSLSLRHLPGSRTFVKVLPCIVRLSGRLPRLNSSMSSSSLLNMTVRFDARQVHFNVPSASPQLIQVNRGLHLRLRFGATLK